MIPCGEIEYFPTEHYEEILANLPFPLCPVDSMFTMSGFYGTNLWILPNGGPDANNPIPISDPIYQGTGNYAFIYMVSNGFSIEAFDKDPLTSMTPKYSQTI